MTTLTQRPGYPSLENDQGPLGSIYRRTIDELAPLGTPTGNPYAPTPEDVAAAICHFVRDRAGDPTTLLVKLHYAHLEATQPEDTAEHKAYRDAAEHHITDDDIETAEGRVDVATDGSGAWVPLRVWICAPE